MINNINLSIVIVNYKNYTLTQKCIKSVLETVKNINYEIIVIDNNSPNDSYEQLSSGFKKVSNIKIIKNDKNVGFGGANNLGVEASKGEYILLLNPDIIVLDDAIEKMYNKINSDKEIGLISGKLLNDDYTIQYSCRRILPFNKFVACRTPLSKIVSSEKREKINDIYLMKDFDHNSTADVEWVMGACMMMHKDEFIKLGGFSKEYFMYFEDVDLCYKVRKYNKTVVYLHNAQMIHLHNQESKKRINKMTFVHLQSMIKFYKKYYLNKF
ncbi:glycosyltransferase family 2 protein [Clostridium celatum]|uniref:Glycosyltransferase, group 2 family protein n=1 Tax=Clostridium celatum DSM 1785 TaxID=545697 RepID=L1QN98_9CLOT|nr:glycosyltransferase family 2 protein [Clostridium celatum]EKY29474.1 glycosyltransferase, group 2 family protein [Clostridium celatum DSM 1785]